jgi:hypothetical protein
VPPGGGRARRSLLKMPSRSTNLYLFDHVFQANHEETMMLTNNMNDIQMNMNYMDTKVKDVDSNTRMLNDGYTTLRTDVSQIETKVAAATRR